MYCFGYFPYSVCLINLLLTLSDGKSIISELSYGKHLISKRQVNPTDGDSTSLPDVLKWKKNLIIENDLRFDPSACGPGLYISDENLQLRKNSNIIGFHSCRVMTAGWSTGIHYWSFRIIDLGSGDFVIGVVTDDYDISAEAHPGLFANSYGLYASNGLKYEGGTSAAFSPDELYNNNDEVGILLDLEARTITFFKNGKILGTAFGKIPVGNGTMKYYPTVGLNTLGHWINIIKTI